MLSNHPAAAHLQAVANYLTAGVPVQAATGVRGELLALPYCEPWERPAALIRCPDTDHPTGMDLVSVNADNLKLVLYDAADATAVLVRARATTPQAERPDIWNDVWGFSDRLNYLAQIVDAARALGIALNMPASSYVRRALGEAQGKEVGREQ